MLVIAEERSGDGATTRPERGARDLLADWAAIVRPLRARDVIRTNDEPDRGHRGGDRRQALLDGERLAGLQRRGPGCWDVPSRLTASELQVEALRLAGARGGRNLSPICATPTTTR